MEEHKRRWERVRNICIVQALAKLGHIPTRKNEKEAWFLSPLRSETEASFHVHLKKNTWYDFGLGQGGSIIYLFMKMNHCSAYQALEYLEKEYSVFDFLPIVVMGKNEREKKLSIKKIKEISHPALVQYLRSREIPVKIARTYCKEVHYTLNNKWYFSLGIKNYNGGWELRNQLFKNSTSPKTYSLFQKKLETLLITEGMFDLLSLAVLKKKLVSSSDCLVLNSLSFADRIHDEILRYDRVLLYLDRDVAGQKAAKNLMTRHSFIENRSSLYQGFKDCNDYLKGPMRVAFQDVSLS